MRRAPAAATAAAAGATAAWLGSTRSFAGGARSGVGWSRQLVSRGARGGAATSDDAGSDDKDKDMFESLRGNEDGVSVDKIIAAMDENGDGTISREEFDKFAGRMGTREAGGIFPPGGLPPGDGGRDSGGSGGAGGGGGPGGGAGLPFGGAAGLPLGLLGLLAATLVAALWRRSSRRATASSGAAQGARPARSTPASSASLVFVALIVVALMLQRLVSVMTVKQGSATIQMTVQGIDYTLLAGDAELHGRFDLSIRETIAAEARVPIGAVSVSTWEGSVVAEATVRTRSYDAAAALEKRLSSSRRLRLSLTTAVRSVSGIQAATDGGPITVGDTSVRARPDQADEPDEEDAPGLSPWRAALAVLACLLLGFVIAVTLVVPRVLRRRNHVVRTKIIGHGTYGEVWEGEVSGKPVAVKVIKGSMGVDDLEAEFQMLQRFRHENIVQVIGFRAEPPSLLMELCKESIYKRVHVRDAPVQVRKFLLGTIQGLHYLHSNQVVHRDLKSHNVLLDDEQTAKLADFGLARVVDTTALFTNASFVGTINYLAPEALASNPEYSFKTDVYAYAVLAWEVASRRIPYRKSDPAVILSMVKEGKREDLKLVVDEELRPFIEKAWAQDPSERYASHEILTLLQHRSMRMWPALMTT